MHPSPREQAGPQAPAAPADSTGGGGPTGYGTGVADPDTAGTIGATTGGFRTTDLDGIGAYVLTAEQDCVTALTASIGTGGPHLANAQAGWLLPVVGAVAGGTMSNYDDNTARAGHMVVEGYPDPAGNITARIGKGVSSKVDDGAVAYSAPPQTVQGEQAWLFPRADHLTFSEIASTLASQADRDSNIA